MKRFMLLHVGFEQPTSDVMAAWNAWFDEVGHCTEEHGGLMDDRRITKQGESEIPFDSAATTGFSIIKAESLEAAQALARKNPFITEIRVYEIVRHGE